jgi:hypothetical protein
MRRCVVLGCVLAMGALTGLSGCGQQSNVRGKVIQGNLGFIGEVDHQDARFAGPGLEGVRVIARAAEGPRKGRQLSAGTTNAKGEFALSLGDQNAALYPMEFIASKDGYGDVRQTMPMPAGRRLLVIMRPRDGMGASAPAGDGGGR